jgi:predicted MFS family arabinose efflux permease
MIKKAASYYIGAYRGIPKNIWWLSVVNLINRMGTMVYPFMTIYMTRKLGYSISEAGFVMACFGIGGIAGSYIGGKLTDKYNFYVVQFGTLLSSGIIFISLGYITHYYAICVAAFMLSVASEAFRPANMTAIGYFTTPENNTKSFSLNRLAFNLGWSVGGSLGGFVAAIDYHLLFWLDGLTSIFSAVAVYIFFHNLALPQKPNAKDISVKVHPLQDRTFLFFCLSTFIFASLFFQHFTNLPAYYRNVLNFNERFIGFLFTLNGLIIVVLEMTIVHTLEKRNLKQKSILIGHLMHGMAFLFLFLVPLTMTGSVIVTMTMTFSEMLAFPVMYSIWIRRTNDQNRGSYAGYNAMSWALAQTVGPYGGAIIAEYFGFQWLWFIVAIGSCCTAYFFWRLANTI